MLSIILSLAAVYLVARIEGERLSNAFQRQLFDASQRVADTSVRQEREHLKAVRALARIVGVPEALAAGRITRLDQLVRPHAANAGLERVVLLDRNGDSLYTLHQTRHMSSADSADYASWPMVAAVREGRVDEQGDKFIGLAQESGEWVLYTAGPVVDQGRQVGAVLVGTSLSQLVRQWREKTLAELTVYSLTGQPIASTLGQESFLPISTQERLDVAKNPARRPQRSLVLDSRRYREVLQPFEVRGNQQIALLGITLRTVGIDQQKQNLSFTIIQLFVAGSIAATAIGILLARRFVTRINALVEASERVTDGDLSIRLPVKIQDELGHLTRSFNAMISGLRERERVREIFGRFVSPTIAELVLQRPLRLRGELEMVTVLFTDIRGFTKMTEEQDPIEVVETLNQYFEIIVDVAEQYHGLVNKFGGDSTLVLFGLTEDDEQGRQSARAAVKTALAIRERITAWNAKREQSGRPPISFGMGINTGRVVAGLIGAQKRMEYTVIGDAVNLSARIQALSEQLDADILISSETLEAMDAGETLQVTDLGGHLVKGKQQEVQLYAVQEWQHHELPTPV